MKNKYILEAGDVLMLEDRATVIKDCGDSVDIEWANGDKSFVWKCNIKEAYRNGILFYGYIKVNNLSKRRKL